MKDSRILLIALAAIGTLALTSATARVSAQDLVISEFMAVNESTLQDEDGDFSDWIEIYNAGTQTANLGGWFLTDFIIDLTKWRFPSVDIPAGGFLLVFASDKDRRRAGSELHCNFKLSSGGEYLALVQPDGVTVAWEYAPFPVQVGDFSYGLQQNASFAGLVESGVPARSLIPSNGTLGRRWTEADFDDSGWIRGQTGVGYDRNDTYRSLINLDVRSQMENVNTTAYVRVVFTVDDPASIGGFRLRVKYDDGFIAYVNGERVASANAPASGSWDSSATDLHDDSVAVVFQDFEFAADPGLLEEGQNVLAIHGLNDNLGSSDFVILPELEGFGSGILVREIQEFFDRPTPGFGNAPGFPHIADRPQFSVPSTVFTGTLSLELSTADPDATIRYTLDGDEPSLDSILYTSSLSLSSSTMVRARTFDQDLSPSPVVSETYIRLASSVRNFTSDIPIVIVDNFGGGSVPADRFQPAFMAIFEPLEGGRSALANAPDLSTRIGIKIRGSSTLGRPKKTYGFEAWDEKDQDKNIAPLGMPRESDWILYGAYNFDRALLRNPFIYDLSNQIDRYATRTRFCEVYVNIGGGSLSSSDYVGVYSFCEKIKRDRNRVDVEKLTASIDSPPEISGGYMMKIDRADPGDSGFNAAGRTIRYVYPKEDIISSAQASWLRNYFNAFGTALNGSNFRDPVVGYARYIEPDSWIDHHHLNVLPMNVDALRLSAYFFKKREQRIEFGPIWDFDRSMGSTDGRDDNPRTWRGGGDATDFFNYPWWGRLFDDPDFWQKWIDRWFELRELEFSNVNINFTIDRMAAEIREAQVRNFQKWSGLGGPGWENEVTIMKRWLNIRADWIDDQFVPPVRFSSRGRMIEPGFELSMQASTGTIYYTLDGTDPRRRGGSTDSGAVRYTDSIVLEDNTRVVARSRVSSSNWSAPTAETYVVTTPRLVITEIMYHPPQAPLGSPYEQDDFEFIELKNAGGEPFDIGGAEFVNGIAFTFPDITLAPGELVVAVKNEAAFVLRYGDGIRVAGEYDLNLGNSGEGIGFVGPLKEPIHLFAYSDAWYPETDGNGDSLNILDPFGPLSLWTDMENWSPSSVIGGTPGEDDPGLSSLGGRQRIGDSNQDGVMDISDAVSILGRLFLGFPADLPCEGDSLTEGGNLTLLDVNGDQGVDLSDALHALEYLFRNGPEPLLGGGCVRIEGCPTICF